MKVYDCFVFYNEIELLNFRLQYLKDYVDYFVIVEADTTYTGIPKKQNFNINNFSKDIQKKIRYQYITYPKIEDPVWNNVQALVTERASLTNVMAWKREFWSRLSLSNKIQDANPEDIIMLSDVDEIPNTLLFTPEGLNFLKDNIEIHNVISLDLDNFHYNINGFLLEKDFTRHSYMPFKITNKKFIDKTNTPMTVLRGISGKCIQDFGWHFSYFGGSEKIKNKLKAFSHTETATKEILNSIDSHVKNHTPFLHDLILSDKYDKTALPPLIFTDEFKDFFEGVIS